MGDVGVAELLLVAAVAAGFLVAVVVGVHALRRCIARRHPEIDGP
ncbi:hypothetical protein [Agrococcus sp. KRD186]|jgi:hypothetical protein|nr:hypothetical protein [Agrococcus sp. KRD186]